MRIAFYENAQDNVPRVAEYHWPELVKLLMTHRRSKCPVLPCPGRCSAKNGPAWSPVDIVERRRTENVRAVTVAVFDLDHLHAHEVDSLSFLESGGYGYALHSTHSHKPEADDYCLRLAMPLSRPVLPREWPAVRAAAVKLLQLPADEATKDLARLYYLPDAPEGTEPIAAHAEGNPLDVEALLAMARAGTVESATGTAPAAPLNDFPPDTGPADLFELRAALRRVRKPEHKEIVRRVLAGEPLAERGSQDNTLNELMSVCAFALPVETPEEAIIAVFRPSFSATDWGEGTEHLCEQALLKYRRHLERRKARDAQRLADNSKLWAGVSAKHRPTPAEAAPDAVPADEAAPDPDAWMLGLITQDNGTVADVEEGKPVKLKNCEANIFAVLLHSDEWHGVLRFNEVTKELECIGGPVRPASRADGLDTDLAVWFQRSHWGRLGLMPKPAAVRDVMRQVAQANAYDPLRDYLEGLVWDGKARLDDMLVRYFGATGEPDYLRSVGAKWALSAVARALRPGCKVDTVLVLEGGQGRGKSTAFRVLAGEWFCDAPINIKDKDSAALASQKWVLELAELTAFRGAEAEELKAFVSRNEDTYRPPYGRVTGKFPRRCVLVGTTNAHEYLRNDPTGYRRWWPVECTTIDLDALRKDRDQLWAEAVMRYHRGEQWWLTEGEARRAEEQAGERSESTGGPEELILQWLLEQTPERRTELTTDQVARDALQIHMPGNITRQVRVEIGRAMHRLGFRRTQKRVAGAQTWVYVAPAAIQNAPRATREQQRASGFAAVVNAKRADA